MRGLESMLHFWGEDLRKEGEGLSPEWARSCIWQVTARKYWTFTPLQPGVADLYTLKTENL